MACSDNVVRAGLTPKLIDVPTLCEMLIYQCPDDGKVDETFKFKPVQEDSGVRVFDAPVPDFSVAMATVKENNSIKMTPRKSASIVLVTDADGGATYSVSGKEGKVKKGLVLFLEANDILEMSAVDCQEPIEVFQAFCQSCIDLKDLMNVLKYGWCWTLY